MNILMCVNVCMPELEDLKTLRKSQAACTLVFDILFHAKHRIFLSNHKCTLDIIEMI